MSEDRIEESVAWSKFECCIEDLFYAVKIEFNLEETELLIETGVVDRLIFVGKKNSFGNADDRYLKLLPQIKLYCSGFTDAYKAY